MRETENIKFLNELELNIYNYIIAHKDQITHMRLIDIANNLHVSPSMITRVAKKLGYEGFTDWKMIIKIQDGKYSKPNKESLNYILDYFNRVNNGEFDEGFNTVAEMVKKCSEVIFFGMGISGAFAKAGSLLFNRKGKKSYYVGDFSSRIKDIYSGHEVAIILTVSGETREINQVLTFLKEVHIKSVVITNTGISLSAKLADYIICYYMPSVKDRYYYSSATQVPVVYILEAIANRI
ncbi:hypothetical protein HMPREF9943_00260 [Eggerthia catenaformis OT 569 = DSM 20559]|uniref:SIS domain-containing protein n=1 Tax=Eggerthia catenaformis OT 569 = DSM 20559 TaxID=999415 RepID=M2NGX3_9FIRM|nr:MurR/RpiR family transcriptional regulator [Eggerthia catenaformis]EMD17473.1 hypothetical protein HMPREF9943_00260 [Eggerthia catenaformis OT 569 = DSM 20559]